ncbi:MAG: hypothetical protein HY350_04375 [Candidatus Omnitrophica bacterium]|nr:hypothetical protein [Candidatus Omnitrophota bacterium]
MNEKRIFLVANSHIDPVWLWDKYEGIDEVINTFRSACDRLDEYPALKFTASSITFYKWVEELAPDVFKRIKKHVKTGRWEIAGGWLVENDCNLPITESFYKSAELAGAYVKEKFGIKMPVAYSPDSFGHPAPLPAILNDTGFKYYIFCRPDINEKTDLPDNLFYWEYNGKKVLCYRLKYFYTQGVFFNPEKFEEALKDEDFVKTSLGCYFFGVGDHGGGPTKMEIDYYLKKIGEANNRKIIFSTCLEFFKEAEKSKNIPTYTGDLHNHSVGCYSVNRQLKHLIRSAEYSLSYAERIPGKPRVNKEKATLAALWEKTLFNQFHDIIAGSSAPDATRQALEEMGGVNEASEQTSYKALKKISSSIPVRCRQGEFRIFNSLKEPVTAPFEIETFLYYRPGAPFKDSSGKVIPIQEITPSVGCITHRWLFIDTIPAGKMKTYYFDSDDMPRFFQDKGYFYNQGKEISNAQFSIENTGKLTGTCRNESFFKEGISFGVIKDESDTWSHEVQGFGEANGYFKETSSAIHNGDIASFLISKQEYGSSSAELLYRIYKGLPYIDLFVKVQWNEYRKILKMEFTPSNILKTLLVKGPGGVIQKKTDKIEEPLHGWILAGDLCILQDGAFAFDRQGEKLRITLVRSSLYGFEKHWVIDTNGPLRQTDIGEHRFKFRFFLQEGLTPDKMDKRHSAFIEPFRVLRENR